MVCLPPKGSHLSIPTLFPSTWYRSMATNKDRIEKLESDMQELKESMQKMTTESQDLGSSIREFKELLSQSRDKSASHSSSKPEEPKSSTHSGERLSQTSRVRSAVNDQPWPTKLDFPRYSGDELTVWLDRMMQYFDYQ